MWSASVSTSRNSSPLRSSSRVAETAASGAAPIGGGEAGAADLFDREADLHGLLEADWGAVVHRHPRNDDGDVVGRAGVVEVLLPQADPGGFQERDVEGVVGGVT